MFTAELTLENRDLNQTQVFDYPNYSYSLFSAELTLENRDPNRNVTLNTMYSIGNSFGAELTPENRTLILSYNCVGLYSINPALYTAIIEDYSASLINIANYTTYLVRKQLKGLVYPQIAKTYRNKSTGIAFPRDSSLIKIK